MAGMCCGVNPGDVETPAPVDPSSTPGRRRRVELTLGPQFNFLPADEAVPPVKESGDRRPKRMKFNTGVPVSQPPWDSVKANREVEAKKMEEGTIKKSFDIPAAMRSRELDVFPPELPKFGMTSVCGRRRDMEDTVAIHPSFCGRDLKFPAGIHFFGVYDGHGCSHVSVRCKDRMHEIVKDKLESAGGSDPSDAAGCNWERVMHESFSKMDEDVTKLSTPTATAAVSGPACRCEMRTPQCEAVGSAAVVALVTPEKIIVSNCGDSRAVLCRNGVAIPLSVDHKPDRQDELKRIEDAGGRVINWDIPRVLGFLAMSRAIGDSYLKPYVISEPEVTVTERSPEDECLILGSDGLWDVVSNETACGVARKCLQSGKVLPGKEIFVTPAGQSSDEACSDASILLTKLALARRSSDNVSVVVVDLRRGR